MLSVFAVDLPVLLPGDLSGTPVWDSHPAALPAVAHHLTFPGTMVEIGATDGCAALLCKCADPDRPVHVVAHADEAYEVITAACLLNDLPLERGVPDGGIGLFVAHAPGDLDGLEQVIIDDGAGVLCPPDAVSLPGYGMVPVDDGYALHVPVNRVHAAREAFHEALAQRRERPAAVNIGTAAALRLLRREQAAAQEREVALHTRARRAYDQMQEAREQLRSVRMQRRGKRP